LVQGTAQPPYIVNQHIEEFLADFGEYLENMEATEFKSLKAGAVPHHH
jgi:insulysin